MTEDRWVCDYCGSTKRHTGDCQHSEDCTCLDCHAVKHQSHGSCFCSLCQDRYRLETRHHSPTAVNPASSSEPGPAVASVAAAPDGGR